MIKHILLSFVLVSVVLCEKKHKDDPLAGFDQHLFHNLAYHYLWPWSQMLRAAAALDVSESREPQIISNSDIYQVNMQLKRFKPDELKVKVKNGYLIVAGRCNEKNDDIRYIASNFVQRFELPPGTKPEEVKAVFKEDGILSITAPKHELPPPPPARDVPIEVIIPQKKVEVIEEKTTASPTTPETAFDQYDSTETTTHVGKIRKKDLKTTTKAVRDNEVTKGVDTNGLDYALVDGDLE